MIRTGGNNRPDTWYINSSSIAIFMFVTYPLLKRSSICVATAGNKRTAEVRLNNHHNQGRFPPTKDDNYNTNHSHYQQIISLINEALLDRYAIDIIKKWPEKLVTQNASFRIDTAQPKVHRWFKQAQTDFSSVVFSPHSDWSFSFSSVSTDAPTSISEQ